MLHIPILRHGKPYEAVDKVEIVHHATGEAVAAVSQANSGMIVRDVNRWDERVLERLSAAELIAISRKAAEMYIGATLPLGDTKQSFDDYIRQLSATTGMPQVLCRANAEKIRKVMAEIDVVLAGLTRGLDLAIIDRGHGIHGGHTISFSRQARTFGAVLPSNSPGVHSLWIPAIALKTPVVLKPGREEPWSPYRIIQAFIAAGAPAEAFGFYPTDHGGAAELLRVTDRSMLFGDASTTRTWANDPRVELHGPGYSKVVFGDDCADEWQKHLDVLVTSIAANGGRSCINASGIWTPRHGREIAEAVAKELAKVRALPADHPDAKVAAFANPQFAEAISAMIDQGLREPGAIDLTEHFRGSPRLVRDGRIAYLLPTVIWCEDREHPLANREFLFPFASAVECPAAEMPQAIGSSLIVSAITRDKNLVAALMAARNVDRLNIGPIPTFKISWDQPHEGNLFEHLYRQRAFQMDPAA
ncbi:MAG TPA: aldehyde dehydrogenase family protein [Phycisphaerae bacterium]|nr:aldehyde dehydrogenase family protein [Phycisphaerae bacterium]